MTSRLFSLITVVAPLGDLACKYKRSHECIKPFMVT
jgi:hypothetical protein